MSDMMKFDPNNRQRAKAITIARNKSSINNTSFVLKLSLAVILTILMGSVAIASTQKPSCNLTLLNNAAPLPKLNFNDNDDGPDLSVDLNSLSVAGKGQQVYIDWATTAEINNKEFTVERSEDGANFVSVKTVPGAGNSSVLNKYSAIDTAPLVGTSFYRLKHSDPEGNSKYTDMLPVTVMSAIKTHLTVSKSAEKGSFKVEIVTPMEEVELHIMNSFGQLVHIENILGITDNTVVDLDLGSLLPAGNYFVKMDIGNNTFIKQLLIDL